MLSSKTEIALAGLAGSTAVMMAAYGAHGLPPSVSDQDREFFSLAAHMQLMQSCALVGISALRRVMPREALVSKLLDIAFCLLAAGTAMFCGFVYLTILFYPDLGKKLPLAPVGAVCMIVGWSAVFVAAFACKV